MPATKRQVSRLIKAAIALALMSPQAWAGFTVATHRAVYDLVLLRADDSAGFSSVKGLMASELTGSVCAGWSVNFRIANRFTEVEGESRLIDSQSTSWESGDGLQLKYSQKQFADNALDSEQRIDVVKASAAEEGRGTISGAEDKEFSVDAAALFPMKHQFHLMEMADAGQSRDVSLVFDASDGEAAYKAISFIGKRRPPGSVVEDVSNAEAAPLKTLTSWPVTISYYSVNGEQTETPSYQISFNLYDNGVATGLVLDYGDFALKGRLAKLDLLESASCE
jgi:hypothetical protein